MIIEHMQEHRLEVEGIVCHATLVHCVDMVEIGEPTLYPMECYKLVWGFELPDSNMNTDDKILRKSCGVKIERWACDMWAREQIQHVIFAKFMGLVNRVKGGAGGGGVGVIV